MYLKSILLSCCIVLIGCQTASVIEQTANDNQPFVSTINQLQATKVKLPSTTKVVLTSNSQRLRNQMIDSPVAVFEVPADKGQLQLTITSEIKDSVFYPDVVITDTNGSVIEYYDNSYFEYRKPRLHLGNRLVAELEFYPPQGYKTFNVIVYTNDEYLKGITYVAHSGRIDAEARGNYMPELKDIAIPHRDTGVIELDVSGAGFFSPNLSATSKSADKVNATTRGPLEATQTYYYSAIKKAVESDDIPKALSLLEEAKVLGIEGAQEVFVKAVNSKSDLNQLLINNG